MVSAGDELQFARHNGEGLRHFSCGPVVRTEDEDRVVVASRGAEISDQAADILIHSVNHRGIDFHLSRFNLPLGRAELAPGCRVRRSEEHTSELQSLMRISYAVFCLKKKNKT